jgi:hypothetical protein
LLLQRRVKAPAVARLIWALVKNLHVAAKNPVIWHVYAEGVQIYRWNGTSWVFVAPEAVLFADTGGHGAVGFH